MLTRVFRAALIAGTALAQLTPTFAAAQAADERFWIAFRFDSTRISVYFDTTAYRRDPAPELRLPSRGSAPEFLNIAVLPEDEASQLAKRPGAARFAVGDKYDLLLDGGHVAVVTLTSLVTGYGGEANIGNVEHIGALATIDTEDRKYFSRSHYALTTHVPGRRAVASSARLETGASSPDDSVRITNFFLGRFEAGLRRDSMSAVTPHLDIQRIILANGARRYYAQAFWGSRNRMKRCFASGWLALTDSVVVRSVNGLVCRDDPPSEASVLAAVDLGNGRTGLVLDAGVAGFYTGVYLTEYRDGIGPGRSFQGIGIGG